MNVGRVESSRPAIASFRRASKTRPALQILERASQLGRPLVTHDIRFKALAEERQRQSRPFCGLIFGHLMQVSVGQCVKDLERIAKATDPQGWASIVLRLPL